MPEIGTFGLMSGDGKRGVGHSPQATTPILNSTLAAVPAACGLVPAQPRRALVEGHDHRHAVVGGSRQCHGRSYDASSRAGNRSKKVRAAAANRTKSSFFNSRSSARLLEFNQSCP